MRQVNKLVYEFLSKGLSMDKSIYMEVYFIICVFLFILMAIIGRLQDFILCIRKDNQTTKH
jgi:hypothetical protein